RHDLPAGDRCARRGQDLGRAAVLRGGVRAADGAGAVPHGRRPARALEALQRPGARRALALGAGGEPRRGPAAAARHGDLARDGGFRTRAGDLDRPHRAAFVPEELAADPLALRDGGGAYRRRRVRRRRDARQGLRRREGREAAPRRNGGAERLRVPARRGDRRARPELRGGARPDDGDARGPAGRAARAGKARLHRAGNADDRGGDRSRADARSLCLARRRARRRHLAREGAGEAVRRLDLGGVPDHGARRPARRQRSPVSVRVQERTRTRQGPGVRPAWIIGGFIALLVLLGVGLGLNPREVPSPLIGKAAPAFELPLLAAPDRTFSQKDMLGRVWVLNVWASWCAPCLIEHPQITRLAAGAVPVVGLNYKVAREDAIPWLTRNGNASVTTVQDPSGRIGLDYGVYGVPETYVIDRGGVIRYKRIGPVTPEILKEKIEPILKGLDG